MAKGIIGSEFQPLSQDQLLRGNDQEVRQALSAVYSRGAFAVTTSIYTSAQSMDHRVSVALCDTSGGAFALTIPYTNYWGDDKTPILTFVHVAGASNVTITASGSDTINGGATYALVPGDRIDLISDGASAWYVFSSASSSGLFVAKAGDTMTGQLVFKDGNSGSYAWKFTSTTTGMYYDSGMVFAVGNTPRWKINTSGHLIAVTDNSYDIGQSGANRPRNLYCSGLGIIDGLLTVGSLTVTSTVTFNGLTASLPVIANASKQIVSATQTGTGTTFVMSARPTINNPLVTGILEVGSGNSSNDSEVRLKNYATDTFAWNLSVRQDIGGANNDFKLVRFNSSGAYQGIAVQVDQATGNVGIGVTPTVILHTYANTNTGLFESSGTYSQIQLKTTGGSCYFGSLNGDLRASTSGDGIANPELVLTSAGVLKTASSILAGDSSGTALGTVHANGDIVQETGRIISAQAYGAVGDYNPSAGTGTDDTAALQSALDAAYTAGGGTVVLENKKYKIASTLEIPVNVTLRGPHNNVVSGWRDTPANTDPATLPEDSSREGRNFQNMGGALWVTFDAGQFAKITGATADAGTDTITATAHKLDAYCAIKFLDGTGTVPGGITAGTVYYVRPTGLTANAFTISATRDLITEPAAVNITSGGVAGFEIYVEDFETKYLGNYAVRVGSIKVRGTIDGVYVFQKNFKNGVHSQATDQARWYSVQADTSSGGYSLYTGVALQLDGENACVKNCFIGGFMQAIHAYYTHRFRIKDVLTDCINGIEAANITDTSFIENVHQFYFGGIGYSLTSVYRRGTFISLRDQVDWIKIHKCFSYGAPTGVYLDDINGATISDCGFDSNGAETTNWYGIHAAGATSDLMVSNTKIAHRQYGVVVSIGNTNTLTLSGVEVTECDEVCIEVISGNVTILGGVLDGDTTSAGDEYAIANQQSSGNSVICVGTTIRDVTYEIYGPVTLYKHGQIAFPSTQNASTGANVLDDYEEGTWTPTLSAATGSFTSASASGVYTKVGRLVSYHVIVTITTNGTAAGNVRFTLPFTPSGDATCSGMEINVTGDAIVGYWTGSVMLCVDYSGAYPGASGYSLRISGHFVV